MDVTEKLNDFFVTCFYSILSAEERALESISNGKLSLKEIHVIEAVFKAKKRGENNFLTIAKILSITPGTLTTAFAKLEKKGYLVKRQDKADKRIYYIEPTRLAELINNEHSAFHRKFIEGVVRTLPRDDLDRLANTLKTVSDFFNGL